MQLGISVVSGATHTTNPALTSSNNQPTGFMEALQRSSSNDAPEQLSPLTPTRSSPPEKPLSAPAQLSDETIVQQSLPTAANTKVNAGSCSVVKNLNSLFKASKTNGKPGSSRPTFAGEPAATPSGSLLFQNLQQSLAPPHQLNTPTVTPTAASPDVQIVPRPSSFDMSSTRIDSETNTIPEDPTLLPSAASQPVDGINRPTFELSNADSSFQQSSIEGSKMNGSGSAAGYASVPDNIDPSAAAVLSPLFPANAISQNSSLPSNFSESAMLMNAAPSGSRAPQTDSNLDASAQVPDNAPASENEDIDDGPGNTTQASAMSPASSQLTPATELGTTPLAEASSYRWDVTGPRDGHTPAIKSDPLSQPGTATSAQAAERSPHGTSISSGVDGCSERSVAFRHASFDQSRAVSEPMPEPILSDPNNGVNSKAHTTSKEASIPASNALTVPTDKVTSPLVQTSELADTANFSDASLAGDNSDPEADRESTTAATSEKGSPTVTGISFSDPKPAVNSNIVSSISSPPALSGGSVTPTNTSLLAQPPASVAGGAPDKTGSPSEVLQPHQMLDAAPDGTPSPGTVPPAAHSPSNSLPLEMQVGVHTSTFGDVQVHTQIEQSQVGISIRADHEFAHWFSPEVGGLENGLKSQHLNLTSIDFSSVRSGAQSDTGFRHGQPQQSFSEKPASHTTSGMLQTNSDEDENEPEPIAVLPQWPESHVSVLV